MDMKYVKQKKFNLLVEIFFLRDGQRKEKKDEQTNVRKWLKENKKKHTNTFYCFTYRHINAYVIHSVCDISEKVKLIETNPQHLEVLFF
jgi:hypothetical protein